MGLGALTKGLHAVFYPLAVVGVLAWRHPGARRLAAVVPAGRVLIFVAVLVPWYAYVETNIRVSCAIIFSTSSGVTSSTGATRRTTTPCRCRFSGWSTGPLSAVDVFHSRRVAQADAACGPRTALGWDTSGATCGGVAGVTRVSILFSSCRITTC